MTSMFIRRDAKRSEGIAEGMPSRAKPRHHWPAQGSQGSKATFPLYPAITSLYVLFI